MRVRHWSDAPMVRILGLLAMTVVVVSCAGLAPADESSGVLATLAPDQGVDETKQPLEGETPKARSPLTLTPEAGGGVNPGAETVNLAPDGEGDYPSLEAAVAAVAPGTTLILEPGTYQLAAPLDIDQTLSIVGAGMDETEIVSSEDGYVVRFAAAEGATLALRDLTVRHEGTQEADALLVESGVILVSASRFEGAVSSEGGTPRAGLRIRGTATGSVEESEVVGNSYDGIRIEQEASLDLLRNLVYDNAEMGVRYAEGGGGTATENTVQNNGLSGIAVSDSATPMLRGNALTGNTESGLVYFGNGGGEATGNDASGNGSHGIAATHDAAPLLEGNTCADNVLHGIGYFERASGTVRSNTCTGNGLQGFAIVDEAVPALEENEASDNVEGGFYFGGTSNATAYSNGAYRNGLSGFIIAQDATPLLVGNTAEDNVENGIGYFEQAGGAARQNTILGNLLHGIGVSGTAAPTLETNTVTDNEGAGIAYFEQGGGSARDNAVSGSTWGIYVEATALVNLGENRLSGNDADLDDRR